jgi:hypothetical protein
LAESRESVLDCGIPLPLCIAKTVVEKRLPQNLAKFFRRAGYSTALAILKPPKAFWTQLQISGT